MDRRTLASLPLSTSSPGRRPRRVLPAIVPALAVAVPWIVLLAVAPAAVIAQGNDSGRAQLQRVDVPPQDAGAAVLAPRAQQQAQEARSSKVFHGFRFEDRLEASGIGFVHRIVDDAGKDYKPVHYDHGNGLSVADVDGDGHLDLYFTTQIGANQLWRSEGDGTFEDWTSRAGVALADKISVTASFGDVDNDGDPDLYVTTVNQGNHLFENRGEGRFRDISEAAGVDHVGHSSGVTFVDFDRDGLLDLLVTNVGVYTVDETGRGGAWVGRQDAFAGQLHDERTERTLLYRNLGNRRFEEVSRAVGLLDGSWTGDATFTYLDDDPWPDLYILNMQGDDHAWRNKAGKGFEDVTDRYFPKSPWGSMGVSFFDWDNDGDQDLYLTDMHSDMSQDVGPRVERLKSDMQWPDEFLLDGSDNIFGNAFWINDGEPPWREASDAVGAENYWPWGISVGDLNADGYQDVFVASSMNYPFRYGINTVLLNDAGQRFQHAEFLLGVEPRKAKDTKIPWFTLDCSGADSEHQHCEGRTGAIEIYGNLGTRSSAFLDLDGDGDLDIVTNDFNSAPMVLVSDLSERRPVRWLGVDLEGTRSNRDGLGAVVEVTAGGMTQTRVHDGKSGYLSQSSMPLYFGLGDATKIDRVEVTWPSGATQAVKEGLQPGTTVTITEPRPEPADGVAEEGEGG